MGFVLFEVYSTVGKLAEGSLLLDLGSLFGVLKSMSAAVAFKNYQVTSLISVTHIFVVGHDCCS